jgi:hypothetical protein
VKAAPVKRHANADKQAPRPAFEESNNACVLEEIVAKSALALQVSRSWPLQMRRMRVVSAL